LLAFLLVAAMVGVAYASVPLYRMFCRVTGFAGTPRRAATDQAPGDAGHMIAIRFDANHSSSRPWRVEPVDTHRHVASRARNIALVAGGGGGPRTDGCKRPERSPAHILS